MTNPTYETIDKIRAIAEDERADPGTRAAARAKLAEYSTALVVRPNKSMTMWDRIRATTETRVADERAKQVAIRHKVEQAESDMAAYRIAQTTRIAKATTEHELYMIEAETKMREARHRAEIACIKLNAERATLGLDPL
jgi:hypothetical protein